MAKKRKSGAAEGVEEVYNVEKIVGKRIKEGKVQYCIKWDGYPDEDNTWEFADNVFCKDLIKEFEEKESKPSPPRKLKSGRKTASPSKSENKLKENVVQPGKWDAYVDHVINVERSEGSDDLIIYLKWHDEDETCHPAKIANVNCPQKIIQFYEDHLKFKEDS